MSIDTDASMPESPPRDNLFRAAPPIELVRAEGDDVMPTLTGHFAVFDTWTEINSMWEGNFLERVAPGAFKKTFRENRDGMRVLFQHGQDPQVGDKVLGPIRELREDDVGAFYEVPLLDTSYVRDLIPGLEAGLYGASFRFRVMREEVVDAPKPSEHNPRGLPERTIKEAMVREFGPVTFGAYPTATAGVRSLTDEFLLGRLLEDPERLERLIEARKQGGGILVPRELKPPEEDEVSERHDDAPDIGGAEPEAHPVESRRAPDADNDTTSKELDVNSIEEVRARLDEIAVRFEEINQEAGVGMLDEEQRAEWDKLKEERARLDAVVADYEERRAFLAEIAGKPEHVERGSARRDPTSLGGRRKASRVPDNIYDTAEYRSRSLTHEEYTGALTEGALRAVEVAAFANDNADVAKTQKHLERLLKTVDGPNRELALRLLQTGSPIYQRAFGKVLAGQMLTPDEQRAMSLTTTEGGYAVPFTLDPTVILTSDGYVNPIRQVARVETIVGNTWKGVSSAGVTASYGAEATETSDGAPTIGQPEAIVEKAQVTIPFSIEIGQDWSGFQSEMARLLQDAKDDLESNKFIHGAGHGSNEPEGLLVGATAVVSTDATATLAVADLYDVEQTLPPRFRARASVLANRAQFNKVRQLDSNGGAALWVQLGDGLPGRLLGYPTFEASDMPSTFTSGSSAITIGDFSKFLIVDRVGMNIEVVQHLFGTTSNLPNGQRALYAYWRNTSDVLAWQAFRTLKAL